VVTAVGVLAEVELAAPPFEDTELLVLVVMLELETVAAPSSPEVVLPSLSLAVAVWAFAAEAISATGADPLPLETPSAPAPAIATQVSANSASVRAPTRRRRTLVLRALARRRRRSSRDTGCFGLSDVFCMRAVSPRHLWPACAQPGDRLSARMPRPGGSRRRDSTARQSPEGSRGGVRPRSSGQQGRR